MIPVALLAAWLCGPCTVQEPDGRQEFRDWVEETAIRLPRLTAADPATFRFLDQALEHKRIVYLGESDHFVAERMEYRLLWIRELARRGFRRIGMEMGLSDARRMDRYLETGDATWLDRVALYGYRGDLREDRRDEVPGWTDDSHPEFTRTVLDEARWFLTELRRINEELPPDEPRLTWFGYDLSFRPGGGYADVAGLLEPHRDVPLVRELSRRLARVPGESRRTEADRLEAVVRDMDERRAELKELLGDRGALEARRGLQRMADAFRFIDDMQDLANFDGEAVAAALARRERRMAHNLDEHLAEWPPDEKIILLGHALHLSKNSPAIRTRDYGAMWESIGTDLNRRLPGEIYAVWLLHNRGLHGLARGVPPVQLFRSPADSVERLLAAVHPRFLLPLHTGDPREAWLQQERVFSNSGAPAWAVLQDQADCLCFVEVAHEPGRRPER